MYLIYKVWVICEICIKYLCVYCLLWVVYYYSIIYIVLIKMLQSKFVMDDV